MLRRIVGFTAALAILMATSVPAQEDDPNAEWCELACAAEPTTVPPFCNCNTSISTGSGDPSPPGGGGGEQTIQEFFDAMVAAYQAEIAQVQNYLLIEKSKAAPMPDIRYYERKSSGSGNASPDQGDGGFVWIPNQELARRDLVANPSNNKTGNSRIELPPEAAADPTLFVNALGDALEILAGFAGNEELGAALGQVADQEAQKIRYGQQEIQEGIEGADTLGGLLTDELLGLFNPFEKESVEVPVRFGLYSPVVPAAEQYARLEPGSHAEKAAAYELGMSEYSSGPSVSGPYDPGIYTDLFFVCAILGVRNIESDVAGFDKGKTIESGELWICRMGELGDRPVRISLTYLEATSAGFVRTTIQKENQDFTRLGPVVTPRQIKNRVSTGTEFFVDELERVIRVNLGPPSQADLAELVGETMDWDAFYQTQGSP